MFQWIRNRVTDAVVAGFGDGLRRVGVEVDGKLDAPDANALTAGTVERLLLPVADEPKRKGVSK